MQRSENSRNRATPAIEVEMYDLGVDSKKKKKKKNPSAPGKESNLRSLEN